MSEESPSTERHSASVAGYEFFHRTLHDPENLPLVVWLRGDEPYCDQFSLDADAVMDILGIRRSRLNQIAGRDLRVGRKRDGRYVRPVFRPEDVEQYKNWTRAPASHLKSAAVVEEMAAKIEEGSRSFLERFQEIPEEIIRQSELQLEDLSLRFQKSFHRAFSQAKDQNEEFFDLFSKNTLRELYLLRNDFKNNETQISEVLVSYLKALEKTLSQIEDERAAWLTHQLSQFKDEIIVLLENDRMNKSPLQVFSSRASFDFRRQRHNNRSTVNSSWQRRAASPRKGKGNSLA